MVRLKGYQYLHLERERGRFKRVVLRVRVWDWFRLGATDVIEAPHEDMIKSYTSFTEAAAQSALQECRHHQNERLLERPRGVHSVQPPPDQRPQPRPQPGETAPSTGRAGAARSRRAAYSV